MGTQWANSMLFVRLMGDALIREAVAQLRFEVAQVEIFKKDAKKARRPIKCPFPGGKPKKWEDNGCDPRDGSEKCRQSSPTGWPLACGGRDPCGDKKKICTPSTKKAASGG